MGLDAVNVQVKIGSTTKNIQMEKGCMFENKGGKYLVDENGKLNVFDKNTNTWKQTSAINMTNYQFKAFQAVANNSNEGSGIILSKKDIELAQEKFRKGEFTADMSELLPDGYKIEKPKLSTSEKYVQAYVTNGKEKESATLKFQIAELADLKAASQAYQAGSASSASSPSSTSQPGRATKVSAEDKKILDPDGDGKFKFDRENFETHSNLPYPLGYFADYGDNEGDLERLYAKLEAFNDKPITPDLVDQLTNALLDSPIYTSEGDWAYTTDSPLHDIARFAEYLKPNTLQKLMNKQGIMGPMMDEAQLGDLRKLYNRLDPAQKDKYYNHLFSDNANLYVSALFSSQASGEYLAKQIFEPKVSAKNYTRIKNFITNMNEPNGIVGTRDQCKILIETLYADKKITQQQRNELLNLNKTPIK